MRLLHALVAAALFCVAAASASAKGRDYDIHGQQLLTVGAAPAAAAFESLQQEVAAVAPTAVAPQPAPPDQLVGLAQVALPKQLKQRLSKATAEVPAVSVAARAASLLQDGPTNVTITITGVEFVDDAKANVSLSLTYPANGSLTVSFSCSVDGNASVLGNVSLVGGTPANTSLILSGLDAPASYLVTCTSPQSSTPSDFQYVHFKKPPKQPQVLVKVSFTSVELKIGGEAMLFCSLGLGPDSPAFDFATSQELPALSPAPGMGTMLSYSCVASFYNRIMISRFTDDGHEDWQQQLLSDPVSGNVIVPQFVEFTSGKDCASATRAKVSPSGVFNLSSTELKFVVETARDAEVVCVKSLNDSYCRDGDRLNYYSVSDTYLCAHSRFDKALDANKALNSAPVDMVFVWTLKNKKSITYLFTARPPPSLELKSLRFIDDEGNAISAPNMNVSQREHDVVIEPTVAAVSIRAETVEEQVVVSCKVGGASFMSCIVPIAGDEVVVTVRLEKLGATDEHSVKFRRRALRSVTSLQHVAVEASGTDWFVVSNASTVAADWTVLVPYDLRAVNLTAIANDSAATVTVTPTGDQHSRLVVDALELPVPFRGTVVVEAENRQRRHIAVALVPYPAASSVTLLVSGNSVAINATTLSAGKASAVPETFSGLVNVTCVAETPLPGLNVSCDAKPALLNFSGAETRSAEVNLTLDWAAKESVSVSRLQRLTVTRIIAPKLSKLAAAAPGPNAPVLVPALAPSVLNYTLYFLRNSAVRISVSLNDEAPAGTKLAALVNGTVNSLAAGVLELNSSYAATGPDVVFTIDNVAVAKVSLVSVTLPALKAEFAGLTTDAVRPLKVSEEGAAGCSSDGYDVVFSVKGSSKSVSVKNVKLPVQRTMPSDQFCHLTVAASGACKTADGASFATSFSKELAPAAEDNDGKVVMLWFKKEGCELDVETIAALSPAKGQIEACVEKDQWLVVVRPLPQTTPTLSTCEAAFAVLDATSKCVVMSSELVDMNHVRDTCTEQQQQQQQPATGKQNYTMILVASGIVLIVAAVLLVRCCFSAAQAAMKGGGGRGGAGEGYSRDLELSSIAASDGDDNADMQRLANEDFKDMTRLQHSAGIGRGSSAAASSGVAAGPAASAAAASTAAVSAGSAEDASEQASKRARSGAQDEESKDGSALRFVQRALKEMGFPEYSMPRHLSAFENKGIARTEQLRAMTDEDWEKLDGLPAEVKEGLRRELEKTAKSAKRGWDLKAAKSVGAKPLAVAPPQRTADPPSVSPKSPATPEADAASGPAAPAAARAAASAPPAAGGKAKKKKASSKLPATGKKPLAQDLDLGDADAASAWPELDLSVAPSGKGGDDDFDDILGGSGAAATSSGVGRAAEKRKPAKKAANAPADAEWTAVYGGKASAVDLLRSDEED